MAAELTRDEGPETIQSELRAAWKIARKRRLGPHARSPEQRAADRDRHLGILARQGFTSDIAYQVIDAELDDDLNTTKTAKIAEGP
jgi:regulatory protein